MVKPRTASNIHICGVPANGKLCEFLGHSSTKGCYKCANTFDGEKMYGGLDVSSWEFRN